MNGEAMDRDAHRQRALHGSAHPRQHTHQVIVDVPSLEPALEGVGETFSVDEALAMVEEVELTDVDRRATIDQAMLCLGELYVHRDLKRSTQAVDPVTALRRLRRICPTLKPLEFHLAMMRIFKSLRDIHTGYILPSPYADMVAFLPFLLGAYWPQEKDTGAKIVVTGLLADFPETPYFEPGVEVISWNGMPIHDAIRVVGREEQASNPAAEFAIGLRLMTVRWFGGSLPPTDLYVTIGYLDREGIDREIRFSWRVIVKKANRIASIQAMWDLEEHARTTIGNPSLHQRSLVEKGVRRALFKRRPMEHDAELERHEVTAEGVDPEVLRAWRFVLTHGDEDPFEFGAIRIAHFQQPRGTFRDGFLALLAQLPETGLIIDIRSNPGGAVVTAECVLQTLTDRKIEPLPFQFLATALVESVVTAGTDYARAMLGRWADRVSPSVDVGSQYSRVATLTAAEDANDIGRKYAGPVVLLTNGVTYSSGDIFAASFQDHEIGKVIGVDPMTGGGGANLWSHAEIVRYAGANAAVQPLRGGIVMHYGVRRCTRVGVNQGLPLEEAGVKADISYRPTLRDLLELDHDLLHFAADILQGREPEAPK